MDTQYQKLVQISYILVSALVAFLLLFGMMKVSNVFDLESKVKSIEFIIRGLSIVIGAGLFFFLYKNEQVNVFMNEVASELLTKVTWPTQKETFAATGVVIVAVILSGIAFGVFDAVWTSFWTWFQGKVAELIL